MSERVAGNTTGPTDAVAGVPSPRRETPSDVPPPTPGLHLAVELDGAGRHPAAWRLTDARDLFTAAHWHRLAAVVDGADLDLLGHVNNVVYADYLQEARVDLMRDLVHREHGEALVVVRHSLDYRSSLGFRFRPVQVETPAESAS